MNYKDEIIDHYKYPRNFGELEKADVTINESNSSCGDVIRIQVRTQELKNSKTQKLKNSRTQELKNSKTQELKMEKDFVIKEMKWRGVGCAISTAAASMLSEKVVGMSLAEIEKIGEEGVVEMMGGEINAGRMKCATLAYRGLLRIFEDKNQKF